MPGTMVGARIISSTSCLPRKLYRPSARPAGTPASTDRAVAPSEITMVIHRLSMTWEVSDRA